VPLHDSLAVLEAAVPGILRPAPLPLEVVCDHGPARGTVLADPTSDAGRLVDVALGADLTERDIDSVGTAILNRLRTL
jgi:pyrimidine-specific ribonucleoside hydrolase